MMTAVSGIWSPDWSKVSERIACPLCDYDLRGLTAAARRVAAGDLSVKVDLGGGSEIASLSQTFNEMVERLGDTSRRFPVLWGQWFISYTVGQYPSAPALVTSLLSHSLC
jgi:hypothetical protein